MSSMLEQAIIDAKALKEAAVKNAESEILEKYSHEIKQAVNSLLEQAEDDLAPEGGADDQFLEQFPNAATSGANFGNQPIDSELVEIDFDQLVAEGVQLDEEEEIEEGLVGDVVKGAAKMAAGAAIDAIGKRDDDDEEELEESEEIEESLKISEDDLVGLIEEFVFSSSSPSPNGYASAPTSEIEEDQEIQRVRKEMEEKEAENKDLKEKLDQLTNQGNKFKRIILELKDKLDEVSLDNARYLYSNRVLKSASLNERQKEKLVESISSAKTIEEAKVIFDTLQSAVGGSSQKKKPKSLDEVVQKRSSRLYHIKEQKQSTSDPAVERMQRLAGIQK
tara:strand:+ start:242 stop:1246 length:1005 start_codon:yes stop_codon:yes gene_type:complete